jgi:diguanylate cyclase (GGDEF)-like protein
MPDSDYSPQESLPEGAASVPAEHGASPAEAGAVGATDDPRVQAAQAGEAQASEGAGSAAATAARTAPEQSPAESARIARVRRLLHSHRARWAAAGLALAAAGIAGSLVGAREVAHSDARDARAAFAQTATQIGSTLKLAIEQQEEITAAAGALFAAAPHPTRQELQAWATWMRAGQLHPALDRLAFVGLSPVAPTTVLRTRSSVSGSRSAAIGAQASPAAARATPVPGRPSLWGARVVSVDGRPYECLASAALVRGSAQAWPASRDCTLTPALLAARASGRSVYAMAPVGQARVLTVDTPVYRGILPPPSAAARRGAFVGWVRELLAPQALLQAALQGHPGGALRVRRRTGAASAVFASGVQEHGAQSSAIDLHDGWTARAFGAPVHESIVGNREALTISIAGGLVGVLLGLLLFVVGSREPAQAQEPVQETAEPTREALYDALTGLPNRALTLDRAERMLARTGRQSGMLAGALLIDVDWFKDLNDKLGRTAGDELLAIVAGRLQEVVRAGDTVGRLADDKFVALVESQARGARLESLARRVMDALHKPVELQGFGPALHLTVSIGLAFGRYSSTDDLLRDAELALRDAKAAGKNRFTLFNANLRSVIEDRGVLEMELSAALQDKQFTLLYQPIYDLASRRLAGIEALIRWAHPKRGLLEPTEFIPLAEETGLIVPIGRWALEEACTQAAAWSVAGHRVAVSVGVSPTQLERAAFSTDVLRALQQSGVEPALLTLSIPEGAVIEDTEAAGTRLTEIKQLGVRIAIDNFGNGYAYRSDLQRLPLDFLRVDRSSLAPSDDEDYRNWLLEAIMAFARDLSLAVIATEVQTYEQMSALQSMGCNMAQGEFMGKPVPGENLESLLAGEFPTAPAMPTGSSA